MPRRPAQPIRESPWRTRIVRYGEADPAQLIPHPHQWRIHPLAEQEAFLGIVHSVGLVQNILVSERTGRVLDGVMRCMLALREGQPTVPVTYVNVSEEEEALILSTFDPIAALAQTDKEQFAALLRDIQSDVPAMQQFLSEIAAKEGLFPDPMPTLDEVEEQYGEHDPRDLWPSIMLKVPPEIFEHFQARMREHTGLPHEQFAALIGIPAC